MDGVEVWTGYLEQSKSMESVDRDMMDNAGYPSLSPDQDSLKHIKHKNTSLTTPAEFALKA